MCLNLGMVPGVIVATVLILLNNELASAFTFFDGQLKSMLSDCLTPGMLVTPYFQKFIFFTSICSSYSYIDYCSKAGMVSFVCL